MNDVPAFVVLPWGARWVRGRPELDGDDIVLAPATLASIDLYEVEREAIRAGRHELPFELAAVETPFDACGVARRYGLLLRGAESTHFREPFPLWETVAGQVRLVLSLALALEREDIERLGALVAPWRHRLPADSPYDTLGQASDLLAKLVNDGLQHVREGVIPAVGVTQGEWRGPIGRLFWAPQFDTLVGYAFHRLAQVVSYEGPKLFECAHCGAVVPREHGNQSTYCGPRHAAAAKKRRQRARARPV
jgi:hypothetical protein